MLNSLKLPAVVAFLHKETALLHIRWFTFLEIYGENTERIKLISRIAPNYFEINYQTSINDIQLTLAKLADPACTRKDENATLAFIVAKFLKESPEIQLLSDMKSSLEKFKTYCGIIITRRNKDIAHFDLSVQLKTRVENIPAPSKQEIESALEELRIFMNILWRHYEYPLVDYEAIFSRQTEGSILIHQLEKSLRYDELKAQGKI